MLEFKSEKFSGPLALLLSLIEKEEMDITEINLAKIADDYVSYIKDAKEAIGPEDLSDFLLLAAKLLYIKSKALLPYLLLDDEDDFDEGDLERQLKMYKEFIEASKNIKNILESQNFLFIPPTSKPRGLKEIEPSFIAPDRVDVSVLAYKMQELLARLEKEQEEKMPEESLTPKVSIEEKIQNIKDLLLKKIKINFSKILSETKDKTDFIVSFLAVLELAKQKELVFEQSELFSEIHILNND